MLREDTSAQLSEKKKPFSRFRLVANVVKALRRFSAALKSNSDAGRSKDDITADAQPSTPIPISQPHPSARLSSSSTSFTIKRPLDSSHSPSADPHSRNSSGRTMSGRPTSTSVGGTTPGSTLSSNTYNGSTCSGGVMGGKAIGGSPPGVGERMCFDRTMSGRPSGEEGIAFGSPATGRVLSSGRTLSGRPQGGGPTDHQPQKGSTMLFFKSWPKAQTQVAGS